MTDLDRMARELLADEYSKRHGDAFRQYALVSAALMPNEECAIAAIRTALLTAPPGYVLVPEDELQRAIDVLRYGSHPQPSPHADALAAMLAAAPEVKP